MGVGADWKPKSLNDDIEAELLTLEKEIIFVQEKKHDKKVLFSERPIAKLEKSCSMNWIFTACVVFKNQFRNWLFQVKNPVFQKSSTDG